MHGHQFSGALEPRVLTMLFPRAPAAALPQQSARLVSSGERSRVRVICDAQSRASLRSAGLSTRSSFAKLNALGSITVVLKDRTCRGSQRLMVVRARQTIRRPKKRPVCPLYTACIELWRHSLLRSHGNTCADKKKKAEKKAKKKKLSNKMKTWPDRRLTT